MIRFQNALQLAGLLLIATICQAVFGQSADEKPTPKSADKTVTLTEAKTQPADAFPYSRAKLTIKNNLKVPSIQSIIIKPIEGGISREYPITVSALQTESISVDLPAIASVQEYEISIKCIVGKAVTKIVKKRATVSWSEQNVHFFEFMDSSAYSKNPHGYLSWDNSIKVGLFTSALIYFVLAAACLLIKNRPLRLAAIVIVTAGVTVIANVTLNDQPTLEILRVENGISASTSRTREVTLGPNCAKPANLTDRSSQVQFPLKPIHPVFARPADFRKSNMIILKSGEIRYTQKPDQLQIFHYNKPE